MQKDVPLVQQHIDSKHYSKYFLFPFLITKKIAAIHYCLFGWKKLYNPSKNFNSQYYLIKYPDIKNGGINPFKHYITHGEKEKRAPWFESEADYFSFAKDFTYKSSVFSRKVWSLFASSINELDLITNFFNHKEYIRQLRLSRILFNRTLLGIHYLVKGKKNSISPNAIFNPSHTKHTFVDVIHGLASNKYVGVSLLGNYKNWIIENENYTIEKALNEIDKFSYTPLISVIIPVYNANLNYFKQAINSVKKQFYTNWELCIADDCSTDEELVKYLKSIATEDKIKVIFRAKNGHISACSNSAIEIATGEYIALLDQDDLLSQNALVEIVSLLNKNKSFDLIFSNEDKIDEQNRRFDPYFKNGWNYHLLLSQNYVSHLGVYKRTIVDKIGGFRLGYEGSQDYDLLLRFIEQIDGKNIAHINKVLYHWRAIKGSTALSVTEKNYAVDAGIKALQDHLDRTQQNALATNAVLPQFYRVKRILTEKPLVSIIIPTRNYLEDLKIAVDAVVAKNNYTNFELIIINNESDDKATLQYFKEIVKNRKTFVIDYPGEFNFSAMNNYAVQQAKGDLILFLNNDVDAINHDWLEEMVSQILVKDVAITGAKLLYPDDTIQHAGVEIGLGGVAGHIYNGYDKDAPNDFGKIQLIQNCEAVTAACLLIKKTDFIAVGGFDETNLKVAFNDVDLCLKIRQQNKKIVYCPDAVLYHHESKSRGNDMDEDKIERFKSEINYMVKKWNITNK